MNAWLKAVRSHSSYIYRHVMAVVDVFKSLIEARSKKASRDKIKKLEKPQPNNFKI